MDVIDVSGWPDAMDEPLGTKPKQWLRHPADDQLWLWKKATWHRGPAGVRLRRGDDWAEKVASVVGGMLDVPVATVELATRHGDAGVISRSVLSDGQELAHGNELLAGFTGVVRDPRDRHDHTIEVIAQVLDGVGPPPGKTAGKAMDWFAGYLILDALISNTDRHQENWAVIDDGGERWLSPSFDHASSLGFQLTDAERDERLTTSDHQRTVAAYANRAKSKFEGEIHPRDAALDAFRRVWPTFREHWREAVASLPGIETIVEDVPRDRMSSAARRFASALYAENHRRLSARLHTMDL